MPGERAGRGARKRPSVRFSLQDTDLHSQLWNLKHGDSHRAPGVAVRHHLVQPAMQRQRLCNSLRVYRVAGGGGGGGEVLQALTSWLGRQAAVQSR